LSFPSILGHAINGAVFLDYQCVMRNLCVRTGERQQRASAARQLLNTSSTLKASSRVTDWNGQPIGSQGMGDSWGKTKSAFVATQVTSRKPPAVTANMMSDQK
jgi:hypothetical protein